MDKLSACLAGLFFLSLLASAEASPGKRIDTLSCALDAGKSPRFIDLKVIIREQDSLYAKGSIAFDLLRDGEKTLTLKYKYFTPLSTEKNGDKDPVVTLEIDLKDVYKMYRQKLGGKATKKEYEALKDAGTNWRLEVPISQ